ncbi:hypothetical protein [uncultured Draconibacterium sp.]|uniref:hypothetical protein n=1 Tax=uncultured Draconibacterium sp. TaxID=1573823 RepID=UPI0029C89168|nr:hypothetical protein [uncultured Draconibacterium sp.]
MSDVVIKSEHIHIIEGLKLVLVSHNSLLDQQSVGNVISELKNNPFFHEEYVVLIDIRNANTKLSLEEIEKLSDFVFQNLAETGVKKFAILATISQINKTVHFVRNYRQSYKYQVFSSIEAALHWLQVPIQRKTQIEIRLRYMYC